MVGHLFYIYGNEYATDHPGLAYPSTYRRLTTSPFSGNDVLCPAFDFRLLVGRGNGGPCLPKAVDYHKPEW